MPLGVGILGIKHPVVGRIEEQRGAGRGRRSARDDQGGKNYGRDFRPHAPLLEMGAQWTLTYAAIERPCLFE